ncbi:hypothetical protein ESCO_004208 [Escovopsis weberi]|uniref:Uncharacterized protein n=1 Tax=Escovopsis weberi TaxID=150374 RepID=A0A0M8N6T8_ESCWE|nr:hypothetical protein ESCO_004208 [Escovopsis weberi]
MGNAQSAAASPDDLRKSRKLSKPPVGSPGPMSQSDNLDFCAGLSESDAANHLSSSYPRLPLDSRLPLMDALPPMFSSPEEPYLRYSRPGSRSTEGGFSEFPKLQSTDQRPYSVYESAVTPSGFNHVDPFDGAFRGARLARAESWHECADQQRGRRHSGAPSGSAGRTGATPPKTPRESPARERRLSSQGPSMDFLPKIESFPELSLTRTESEVTFFAPARRRSMIQVPGMATRPEPEEPIPAVPPLPARSKSKKSLKIKLPQRPRSRTESHANPKNSPHTPVFPVTPRRSSVCSQLEYSKLPKRACTPNNVDYQQLGGHKFGTLRIMNASPEPSSARPSMEDAARSGALPRGADGTGLGIMFGVDFSFEESELVHLQLAKLESQSPRGKLRVTNGPADEGGLGGGGGDLCASEHPTRKLSRRLSTSLNRLSLFLGGLSDSVGSDDGTLDTPCSSRRKSLCKPDSGYGSQTSLRDLHDAHGSADPNKLLPSVSLRRLSLSRRARTSSNPPTPNEAHGAHGALGALRLKKAQTQLGRNKSLREESGSLRKRPSFTAMAEAAHAAFSSKLRHRKSIAGHGLREESKRYP